jgi:hypothetical protein
MKNEKKKNAINLFILLFILAKIWAQNGESFFFNIILCCLGLSLEAFL